MNKLFRQLVAFVAAVLFAGAASPGTLVGAPGLRAARSALAAELASNPFGEPLVIRSQEVSRRIEGHAYAMLDVPFTQVGVLADPAQWCDLLMLHLNNKYCRRTDEGGVARIELHVGKKVEQSVRSATRLRFEWLPSPARADYLAVQMAAPDGPYDTRDYSLALEAVPVEGGRTFIHLGYAFSYGGASHFAMHLYLATVGRDKVGFSPREPADAGDPPFVGGMRGVVERNVMRYLLALRSHVTTLNLPAPQRLDARLQSWFAATERYPRQLHEVELDAYLKMKRNEYRRLVEPD
jgi:hypothetical protein